MRAGSCAPRRRLALALLALPILLAGFGGAVRAEPLDLGGVTVEIPAPTGYVALDPASPAYPEDRSPMRTLAIFVPPDFVEHGSSDGYPDVGLRLIWRQDEIAAYQLTTREFGVLKRGFQDGLRWNRMAGGPLASYASYEDYRISDELDAEDAAAHIGIGWHPPGQEYGRWPRPEVSGTAILLVHGRVLIVYLQGRGPAAADPEDVFPLRDDLWAWVDAIRAANSEP